MYRVKVPATSANLGCGFDTLGIALSIYNTFTFEPIDSGYKFIGVEDIFNNSNNLVYTSFLTTLDKLNKKVSGVQITFDCHIPMAGGLGSSSTCVVAGIYGAYALTDTPINREDILAIATGIEGHPDNVAPAIFGGLTASCVVDKKAISMQYEVDERFQFLAIYPNFQTLTHEARKVLPKVLPYEDAIFNVSRIALVLKAFETYNVEVLRQVNEDKLHEPYRKQLIHEYDEVRSICELFESVTFFISGSGSTLMNVMTDTKYIENIRKRLDALQYIWKAIPLKVDKEGSVLTYVEGLSSCK